MIFVFVICRAYWVSSTDDLPPANPLRGRGDFRLRIGLCSLGFGLPGLGGSSDPAFRRSVPAGIT